MNDSKNQTSFEIKQVISQPYKYGFQTKIETETFPPGINENIVELISTKKEEPEFLLNFRLKAYKKWKANIGRHLLHSEIFTCIIFFQYIL
jgi:Fe-S cluster assembly protein SufB